MLISLIFFLKTAPNAYSLPRPDIISGKTSAPQYTLGGRNDGLSAPKVSFCQDLSTPLLTSKREIILMKKSKNHRTLLNNDKKEV